MGSNPIPSDEHIVTILTYRLLIELNIGVLSITDQYERFFENEIRDITTSPKIFGVNREVLFRSG